MRTHFGPGFNAFAFNPVGRARQGRVEMLEEFSISSQPVVFHYHPEGQSVSVPLTLLEGKVSVLGLSLRKVKQFLLRLLMEAQLVESMDHVG